MGAGTGSAWDWFGGHWAAVSLLSKMPVSTKWEELHEFHLDYAA